MKRLITSASILFVVLAGSGMAFAAEPPETDVLDRHAVWTYRFEGGEKSLLTEGAAMPGIQNSGKAESDSEKLVGTKYDTAMYDSSRTSNGVVEID